MPYMTVLIDRSEGDEDGQGLADKLSVELDWLSDNGLDGFMLTPVQNAGRTVSIIIAARGVRPGRAEAQKLFTELTGYDSPLDMIKEHNAGD